MTIVKKSSFILRYPDNRYTFNLIFNMSWELSEVTFETILSRVYFLSFSQNFLNQFGMWTVNDATNNNYIKVPQNRTRCISKLSFTSKDTFNETHCHLDIPLSFQMLYHPSNISASISLAPMISSVTFWLVALIRTVNKSTCQSEMAKRPSTVKRTSSADPFGPETHSLPIATPINSSWSDPLSCIRGVCGDDACRHRAP